MDWLFEDSLTAAEDFYAVFVLVDAAGFGQFAYGDWAGWVDAALVDPVLDAFEVDGGHFEGEAVKVIRPVMFDGITRDWDLMMGIDKGEKPTCSFVHAHRGQQYRAFDHH